MRCRAREGACMHARSRGSRIVWTNANADKEPIQAVSLRGAIELVINPSPSNYSFYLYPRPDLPTVEENYANITLAGDHASVGCSRHVRIIPPEGLVTACMPWLGALECRNIPPWTVCNLSSLKVCMHMQTVLSFVTATVSAHVRHSELGHSGLAFLRVACPCFTSQQLLKMRD